MPALLGAVFLLERGPEHRFKDVRLPHESEVAGMGGLRGALRVLAVKVISGDVIKLGDALLLELLISAAESGIIGIMENGLRR